MTGRIRQLKPDWFLDEEFWDLQERHPNLHLRQAFEGLWCHSDREGRFEWRPLKLKAKILPYWDGNFAQVLDVLVSAGYVVRYEIDGRGYGACRSFKKHQRPGNREPDSVLPAPANDTQVCSSNSKPAEATRASIPTPLPKPVTPIRSSSSDGCSRTTTMPGKDPPQEYLDEALMGGVSLDQARSTWSHYFGAGLPAGGVERLHPWLVQRAIERRNQLNKAAPRAGPRPPSSLVLEPTAKHEAYARKHNLDLAPILRALAEEGVVESLGLGRAKEILGQRLAAAARQRAIGGGV